MTTLAVIGDVHAAWSRLERVCAALRNQALDGVLLVGDLAEGGHPYAPPEPEGTSGYARDVARVLETVGALGAPLAWVPGNHDQPNAPGPGNVDGCVETVAGLRVAGLGGAGPARFGFPYEWGEDELRSRSLPEWDLLIAHTPPHGTGLGRTAHGIDVGSVAIRERLEGHGGAFVCGHIHEAAGTAMLGHCLCLNAGALGEPYGRAMFGLLRRREAGQWEAELVDLDRDACAQGCA